MAATIKIRRLAGALPLLLSACASTGSAPSTEARFGESVRATLASQVIHPEAARNANPVLGIDGHAARGALKQYEKTFDAPPAPAALSLTIGGGK
jgi:hypothetical protein